MPQQFWFACTPTASRRPFGPQFPAPGTLRWAPDPPQHRALSASYRDRRQDRKQSERLSASHQDATTRLGTLVHGIPSAEERGSRLSGQDSRRSALSPPGGYEQKARHSARGPPAPSAKCEDLKSVAPWCRALRSKHYEYLVYYFELRTLVLVLLPPMCYSATNLFTVHGATSWLDL